MNPTPVVPWQVTGNHWLALPCIHPADGSLHALGVLHRGARSAVEFAGCANFLDGTGPPLFRPVLVVDGVYAELGAEGLAWERSASWLPTFTCTVGSLVVRGTVFAPFGRDADVAGMVYAIAIENRGENAVDADISLHGVLGHRQHRVRTPRPAEDAHRLVILQNDVVVLEGTALPGLVALAVAADTTSPAGGGGETRLETEHADTPRFAVHQSLAIQPGGRASTAFYIAAGAERDGAEATVGVMRRRGWSELLSLTREALRSLEQTVGHESIDRLINRNLLFSCFYGAGRALDDAHFYLVRSRCPWNGRGVTVSDWEALAWTLPAVQLADSGLARELLLRSCELHGYAPGSGVHYLDGTLFESGFSLEGAASFAIATDRYIRGTGDEHIVDEPILADTLYVSYEDISARRHEHIPLYSTEITPSGTPAPLPFTLHGNAVLAQALDVFRRTLDEETAREVEDPEAVRAAISRHFAGERDGKVVLASAINLSGGSAHMDDATASAYWLPLYEAVERSDSIYRRTVRGVGAEPRWLAQQCARLMGPEAATVLEWLRRAPLDNGVAAEEVDAEGRGVANGGDGALAGLLAWSVWHCVHVLGVRP
ncbi:MAG: hypothetical protein ABR543_10100 [Gemmatimonadaceae bacterium]